MLILLAFFFLAGATAAQSATDASVAPRLVVFQRVPLSRAANGIDGELQLMQDSRLTSSLFRQKVWGFGDLATEDAEVHESVLKDGPFQKAYVRIVSSDGRALESEPLERPLARLEGVHLYSDNKNTYLVTVDYSAGWGSYSGPATLLAEVKSGRIHWLEATDGRTGKSARISLAATIKSVWKIVPVADGSGKDILEALCRPSFEVYDETFKLIYIRYHFDGKRWVLLEREQKGYSDFMEGFPARSLFP